MIVVGVIIFVAVVAGLYKARKESACYTSFETTLSVKGIFVAIVFFSHFRTYPGIIPNYDFPVIWLCDQLGQMMVAVFLFYSGYGVFESVKTKGLSYVKKFPRKRILKVLLQFDVAVMCFLGVGIALGDDFSLTRIVLSLIAWDDLGNSNWFVFAILCTYIFSYFSCLFLSPKRAVFAVTTLSVAYIVIIKNFKSDCWWDTILCFPAGMFFSLYKGPVEKILRNRYGVAIFAALGSFLLCNHFCRLNYLILGSCRSILFSMLLMFFLFRFPIDSIVLKKLGNLVFPIYILQRIPMIVLKKVGLDVSYEVYFFMCAIVTVLLAWIFDKGMKKIPFLAPRKESDKCILF